MRTPLVTAVFGAALLMLGAANARAEEVAKVTIPFPFEVNGHTLPAGRYDVRTIDADPSIVMLIGIDGTKGDALVPTIADYRRGPDKKPALTFMRRGKGYELSIVRESGDYARDVVNR